MFIGTKKRKLVSAAILLIIGFLIHIKNMKTGADQLKVKLRDKDMKKVPVLLILLEGGKGQCRCCFLFQN